MTTLTDERNAREIIRDSVIRDCGRDLKLMSQRMESDVYAGRLLGSVNSTMDSLTLARAAKLREHAEKLEALDKPPCPRCGGYASYAPCSECGAPADHDGSAVSDVYPERPR